MVEDMEEKPTRLVCRMIASTSVLITSNHFISDE